MTTASTNPIDAAYAASRHRVSVVGVTAQSFRHQQRARPLALRRSMGLPPFNLRDGLTAGAFSSVATQNASAALYIGSGVTTKFNKGIVVFNAVLTHRGGATNGVHGVAA